MKSFFRALLLVMAASSALAGEPSGYRVIVHPDNDIATLDRKFLMAAFLKKATRWQDDAAIRPVDLEPDSKTRERFSADVLSRSVPVVKSYWQQIIFSGRDVPPPELDSDSAVVAFVLKNRGAVGYVSPNADIRGARVVAVK